MSKIDFQFIDDIRLKVCKECSKSDANGKCIASPGTECVLERYLPQVAKALETARGASVNDYLVSLRTEVCPVCGEKNESGYCYAVDSFGCPLETFFQTVAKAAAELEAA
ncbi:MAG TPA: hypothetical protein VLX91_14015 [Candidatus Acidoferrales bacterium]|nr:hypothetical protein [Candidatus Acidoferrales bacterium]